MMRYRYIITCVLAVFVAVVANAQIDSLSYALGYLTSTQVMKHENNDFPGLVDLNPDEYLSGLKDGMFRFASPEDSVSRNSYYAGFLQGNYWTYMLGDSASYNCVIAGATRVIEGNVSLPNDTIRAIEMITHYEDLDSIEQLPCEFFEALGIILPYRDDFQAIFSPDSTEVDYSPRAYAHGFVDAMEINTLGLTDGCNDSYKWGKWIGSTISATDIKMPDGFNKADFLKGSEATFSKSPQLIDSLTCIQILGLYRNAEADVDTVAVEEVEPYYGYSAQDDGSIFSSVSVKYSVDWQIEVFPVAKDDTTSEEVKTIFVEQLRRLNAKTDFGPGLKAYTDGRSRYFSLEDKKLPKGYRWFSTVDDDGRLFFGIMTTKNCFKAKVKEIELETFMGRNEHEEAQFKFKGKDARRWADFTRNNIGSTVVMMVNGRYVMSPTINSEIMGGACTISGSAGAIKRFLR